MRRVLTALLTTAALSADAIAQEPTPRAVHPQAGRWRTLAGEPRDAAAADTLVARLLAEHRLGAISVAVVQDGRLAYSGVAGEVEPGRPADTSTVFRAASLGKPVFAYLVLRLVDEGVLGLDSPIADVMPRPLARQLNERSQLGMEVHRETVVEAALPEIAGVRHAERLEDSLTRQVVHRPPRPLLDRQL